MEIQALTVEKVIIKIKHRNIREMEVILICILYTVVQVFTNVFESFESFERDCKIDNCSIYVVYIESSKNIRSTAQITKR